MNPARSPTVTSTLPARSANASTSTTTEGSVSTVEMTSTRPITGAGLNQCMPMTRDGRRVAAASWVTESAEVLVAKIVSGPQSPSSVANSSVFMACCSGMASMTSSTSARAFKSVPISTRARSSSRSSAVSLPRSRARDVECSRWARPRAAASLSASTPITLTPIRARTSAMPAPMVPRPTTPTDCNSRAIQSPRSRPVGVPDHSPVRRPCPYTCSTSSGTTGISSYLSGSGAEGTSRIPNSGDLMT